jgi:glycine/D-amino acid oxidase-like deaminating enzyme
VNPTRISLWWDTLPAELTAPLGAPLRANTTVDVAIVGAGYTGLWTAYYLLKADPTLRIAIIESEVAGFGASGRNGGWASALFPIGPDAMARAHGREAAIAMKLAMFKTVDDIGAVAAREGWDIDWAKGGTVVAARTPLQWESAQREVADAAAWGFESDLLLLNAEQASQRIKATDTLGATFTPHCAAINPAKLVRSLAYTVRDGGALIYEGTRALAIEPGQVHTSGGTVSAGFVVRATEGYTKDLAGHKRELAPVYSLMLATEPLSASMWDEIGLSHRETFADGRHLIIYGQRTVDDRIAFGGRGAPYYFGSKISARQDRNRAVHAELWRVLIDLFPVLRSSRVTHTWGGPLGVPRDWWASCGLDGKTGLAWSGGYVGDGVGTSHLGGQTLADLITGQASPITELPWVGHNSPKWEPEPLRWLGTNVGLKVMTRADEVENRTGRSSRLGKIFSRQIGH